MAGLLIQRRQQPSRWLAAIVPIVAVLAALGVMGCLLFVTGYPVWSTYGQLLRSAFTASGALTTTLTFATPLIFTGLAVAVAFRVQLFNIGGEGQLYLGAIAASGIGIALAGKASVIVIPAMCLAGALGGAAWALIPGLLRAFTGANEILSSLMMNYVAGLILNYLIIDSFSYWRDPTQPSFPLGKTLGGSAVWPTWGSQVVIPFGMVLGIIVAVGVRFLYSRTRFGFAAQVFGDSEKAARYAGIRTRLIIVTVMAFSGALAGLGGASLMGDFAHQLDATGIQQSNFGYTGIVVAALARYNPLACCMVAVLIGGLENAGFALEGANFPSGLVGIMRGLILFAVLVGEALVRYRIRRKGSVVSTKGELA